MRRPLVCLCFCEAFGILLSFYTAFQFWHLCIFCTGAFVFMKLPKKNSMFTFALVMFFLFGFCRMETFQSVESALLTYDGEVAELCGVVKKVAVKKVTKKKVFLCLEV